MEFEGQSHSIVAYLDPTDDPQLFYWLKDKSSLKAEVDFVYSHNGETIPIEVKNQRSAKSRSLSLIIDEIPSISKTIKFSPDEILNRKPLSKKILISESREVKLLKVGFRIGS